jgi:dipeptidyl aminopeptidase/acylaminoacyl peptidase
VNVGSAKLRQLQWADNVHLLLTISTTTEVQELEGPKREWGQVIALNVAAGKQRLLMEGAEDAMNVVVRTPQVRVVDGKTYAFAETFHFTHSRGTIGLFRVDLDSGLSRLVQPGSEDTDDWFVDRAGAPLAEVRYQQASGRWTLLIRKASGDWVTSKTLDAPIDVPSIAGYGKDGQSLMVVVSENGKSVFHAVSLADGAWGAAEPNPYDELLFDDTSHSLLGGLSLEGDDRKFDLFDPMAAAVWKGIAKAYPGERVLLTSWTTDRHKAVVRVDGPQDGYGYALVDIDKKSSVWLADIYGDVPTDQIAQPKALTYKAADGLGIPAYLTLPIRRDPKGLPLIVMPHGGPAARDTLDFDWLREALVSRGYAVLQPNFRGSSGYPDGFLEAGYGEWGRKMQTDLSDGVRYLAAQGIVDPRRVCIFGWSYGGYAALAGAALDKGVYRCAADMAGPSDLRLMLKDTATRMGSSRNDAMRYWARYMQVKGADDPALDRISPAVQAAKVDIPILIVHGKDDTVVDFRQSQVMANALKAAGKPYTLVALDGEDHWGSRSETRLKLLQAVTDFMLTNNPPDPPK